MNKLTINISLARPDESSRDYKTEFETLSDQYNELTQAHEKANMELAYLKKEKAEIVDSTYKVKHDSELKPLPVFQKETTLGVFDLPQPVMKSVDGFSMFENSKIHVVTQNLNSDWYYLNCYDGFNNNLEANQYTSGEYKVFSTVGAADAWIKQANRKPILKSEDGVDLFDGDRMIVVQQTDGDWYIKLDTAVCNQNWLMKGGYKFFKNKENAKEWIKENNSIKVIKSIRTKHGVIEVGEADKQGRFPFGEVASIKNGGEGYEDCYEIGYVRDVVDYVQKCHVLEVVYAE